jgi:membrane-associated phospholipid phosphatase
MNKLLKVFIQEPRPYGGREIMNEEYIGIDKYGMPSGHAQSVFFSMTYLYLVKGSPMWLLIEMFVVILTLYQRYSYKQHSIKQLFAGSVIGFGIAHIAYFLTKDYLMKS